MRTFFWPKVAKKCQKKPKDDFPYKYSLEAIESYRFGCTLKTKPRSKNETSREIGQKKRNLGGGRFLKKKNETCPKGRFQKKNATWPTARLRFF